MSIVVAMGAHLFMTIHMSIFVLWPLSNLIASDNKKIFWKLFIWRLFILFFMDLFIPEMMVVLDFISVFIGAFIVVPIVAIINKKNPYRFKNTIITDNSKQNPILCSKCGNIISPNDKFCPTCGDPVVLAKEQYVSHSSFDNLYLLDEKQMVEQFIQKELDKDNFLDTRKMPKDYLIRKHILNIIFAILIFIYISLIFFHFPIYTYIISTIILIIYFVIAKKYNLMKYIVKQVKTRPQEKISNIVMNIKEHSIYNNSFLSLMGGIIISVALSGIIYMNPRIIYEKMDNGYGVRYYLFGITNFTSATIPATHNGEKVISLRGNSFSNMYFLNEVSLPDTITEIRGQAFMNDINLEKVNLPSHLEYLGGGSFYNCRKIKEVIIPDTVTYMGGEIFKGAVSLEKVVLSNNITEIRGNSFEDCESLKEIAIPDKVTRIGGHAFYGCSNLENVDISINSQLQEIGSSAFRRCNKLYTITIPRNTVVNQRAFKESPTQINYYQ